MPEPKFRIAICGGGIGGLALAAFVSQHSVDIAVDIYEAKSEISSIGAAIAIWKRSWQVLQDLGLEDELKKRNLPLPKDGEVRGPTFRVADRAEGGYDFHSHMMPYGPTSIPRPILLSMLQAKLSDNCVIHTSKRLTSYNILHTGSVLLHFADGSNTNADVLVGADGFHSVTRATLFKGLAANPEGLQPESYLQYVEPKWSGTLAYRGIISADKLRETYPNHQALSKSKIWCGKNKHVVSNPFGSIISMVCFYTEENAANTVYNNAWVADVPTQEIIDSFEDWEPDLRSMLPFIQDPSRWAIHVITPLPFSTLGPVALLGDAAHAMTPHQGVGGGQAIEDAYILGRLLSLGHTQLQNISHVLKTYQTIRLPLAQRAAERSYTNGLMYEFQHPDFLVGHDTGKEKLEELGKAIRDSFSWLAEGGCRDDWIKAQELLRQFD